MSDTDTSCYVNTLHRNTPTLSTCIAHTLFSLFPAIQPTEHGERSRVQPGKPHSESCSGFSWTELAQPLTAPECGVTFADRKEKRRTYVNTTKHKDTLFNTQEKPSYPFLTSNLPVFLFPIVFCLFRKYGTRIFAWIALKFRNLVPGYYLVLTLHF